MTDFPDFQEPQAAATALSTTNLTGTGLAKEAGGNLQTARTMLDGTAAGALLGQAGNTIAKEIAAMIAGGSIAATPGGTPLLHGVNLVFAVANQVIAAGGTFNTGNITFTKPGYLIRLTALMSAGASAVPTVQADLSWRVAAQGTSVTSEEKWYCPAGGTSARRTNGKGTTKGDTLSMALFNGDAVNSVTVNLQVWETTQHIARDDWRSDGTVGSSVGTGAAGDILANVLASESVNVGAGLTAIRNLPLYAGQVIIWINQNVAAGSLVQVFPTGDYNLASIIALASLDWTQAPHGLIGVTLPRAWCTIQATNNAAGAVFFNYSVMALEYAS